MKKNNYLLIKNLLFQFVVLYVTVISLDFLYIIYFFIKNNYLCLSCVNYSRALYVVLCVFIPISIIKIIIFYFGKDKK